MAEFSQVILWIAYLAILYSTIFWVLVFFDPSMKDPKKKRITNWPVVTVAVPAYNEEKHIIGTLESVISLDYPKELLDIIVVSDGSKDKTASLANAFIKEHPGWKITLIDKKVNEGKGAALNDALETAKGEFFVCFDADSFVEPDALKKLLPYFAEDNIAVVLPMMKTAKPQTLLQKVQWYEYLMGIFLKRVFTKVDCIQVAPGPFSVYKTDMVRKIGGWDKERNLTEDFEFTLRVQKNHYKIIQCMETSVYTHPPRSIAALSRQRNRWFKGSAVNLIKHRDIIFNKKFGDFGVFQIPSIIIIAFLAVIMLSILAYNTLKPIIRDIANLRFINFDILTMLKNFEINFSLLDQNFTGMFFLFVVFFLAIFVLVKSAKHSREKTVKHGSMPILIVLLFYGYIMSFIWLKVLFELTFRRKHSKW